MEWMHEYKRCMNCDNIFDVKSADYRRFDDESGPYDDYICPKCKSFEVEEAYRCGDCGGIFPSDEMYQDRICKECLRKELTLKVVMAYAQDRGSFDELADCILGHASKIAALTNSIETVAETYPGKQIVENSITNFALGDKEDFVDYLLEKKK